MASSTAEVVVRAKDEASSTLRGISQGFSTLKGGAEDAGKGAGALGAALAALKQHVGTIGAITLAVTALQGAMNLLGRGAGAIKDSFIGFNAALESNRTAFTNMLGSAQQANVFLKQLSDFANKTPFTFPELTTASQRMLAFGFSAQQVIPLLTAVGNQASLLGGGSEQIDRLTLALGQMQAKGKVSGDELLQLTEAGVKVNDIFAIIAKQSGKTTDQIVADQAKGKLSSQDFIAAFEEYSGRFGDVMGAQSRTFSGAMSTIQDTLQSAGARAFAPFFDLIRDGAVKLADFLQTDKFQTFIDVLSAGAQKGAAGIRSLFEAFQADGIAGVLDTVKAKVVGFFESFAGDNARTAGSNFIVTFATGMYEAAQGVLTSVVNDIASFVGDFFIGHSPPPKGPLKEIHKGGALLMQELTAGMSEGLDGSKLSAVASDLLGTITGALSAGEGGDFDFSKIVDGIRSGTMSMDELKAASEGVDDVTRMIGEQIQDIADKQSDLKDQINDIKFSYEDQIDPLQRQLDSLKSVVDWTTKQRDLELEISQNKIEQQMAGDPTLAGLNKSLAGLESQQRTSRTAPVDRTLENQIAALQKRERGLPTGKAGADARKSIEDQIAGLREKERVEKDGDTDTGRALQARIDGVKQEIDARKATYQTQLDSIKAEKDSVDLKAKGLELQRQLQELPLERKISDLKNAEADRIQPLQRQYDLLDRQRQTLESQKARWGEIKQEITDALQPLQELAKLQEQQAAAAKAAAGPKAKTAGAGGLPNPPKLTLATKPVGSDDIKGGSDRFTSALSQQQFDDVGKHIGESLTRGAVNFLKEHIGSLIGTAIGSAVGGAVLGPPGALIGGLLGGRIGTALQSTLGGIFSGPDNPIARLMDAVKIEIARFKIAEAFGGGWKAGVRLVFDDLLGVVSEWGGKLLDWIGKEAPIVGNKLIKWAEEFVDFVKPYIGPMLEALGGLATKLYEWALARVPEIRDKLLKWADEFVHWIAPRLPDMLVEAGKLWLKLEGFIVDTGIQIAKYLLKWGEEFVAWVGPHIPPLLAKLGDLMKQLLGWVEGQLPGLVVKLAGWAGEFVSWVVLVWPKLLLNLADLLGKIGTWVTSDAAKELKDKVGSWVTSFGTWILDLLDPNNEHGIPQGMAKIGKTLFDWIKQQAPLIGTAMLAFVKPFTEPFAQIGEKIEGFLGNLKKAINWVAQQIAGKDIFGGMVPSISIDTTPVGGGPASAPASGVGAGGSPLDNLRDDKRRGHEGNAIDPTGKLTGHGDFPDVGGFIKSVGDNIGSAWDTLSGAVKDGGGALLGVALKKFGVSLDLPGGFAGFGAGMAEKVIGLAKDSIGDLVKKLFDGAGGSNDVVRIAMSMLSGDGDAWNNWCQRFVDDVRQAAGFGRSGAASARVHAIALEQSGQLRPGWGPPGSAEYYDWLPDGHVMINGPTPGSAISTGPWGIQVIDASRFGSPSGWAPINLGDGGVITEHVVGRGMSSGREYHIGERGTPEHVIPADKLGGGGGDTYLHVDVHVAGSVIAERDLAESVHQGLQEIKRRGALKI
jgi:tape measure domain-containing protein